ncbi:hypothetical protein T4C_8494 [Trichinella pseudospiralis]|uniref:Uncharacterized protein n=1 Tax=Trichinella pseudospiralis TaxID=6337 RepID=A0A0V1GAC8_TRIPS|nr:hypothetical protein T4C_8494 [Trichinella pseudospiralis]
MTIVEFYIFFYCEKFLQVNQQKGMCERRKMFKMAWNQQIVYGRTTCR